jgi:hypothetical protein
MHCLKKYRKRLMGLRADSGSYGNESISREERGKSAKIRVVAGFRLKGWRKRVRVERTIDRTNLPIAGFEDREDHRTPFASVSGDYKRTKASRQPRPAQIGAQEHYPQLLY